MVRCISVNKTCERRFRRLTSCGFGNGQVTVGKHNALRVVHINFRPEQILRSEIRHCGNHR